MLVTDIKHSLNENLNEKLWLDEPHYIALSVRFLVDTKVSPLLFIVLVIRKRTRDYY